MTTAERFWSKAQLAPNNECFPWLGAKHQQGYGTFRYQGKSQYAHRVAWILVNGSIPNRLHILHRCDNPGCVRPDHMFLGTNKDNIHDSMVKGRRKGVKHPGRVCKLSFEQVKQIRVDLQHTSQQQIADAYGVSASTISLIATGRRRQQA